ncbi:MAG: hypothetical protein ACPG5T_08160, partial [Endozoicomonas sp.]
MAGINQQLGQCAIVNLFPFRCFWQISWQNISDTSDRLRQQPFDSLFDKSLMLVVKGLLVTARFDMLIEFIKPGAVNTITF